MSKNTTAGRAYGFERHLDHATVDEALEQDVDFRRYLILGACNPQFAYKALQSEDKIGTMLPCNVVVQDVGNGEVEVSAVDPVASMTAINNPNLAPIAGEVGDLLREVVSDL